uniref:Uncharacterized protein n=1 Tax=Rhizophora mucronata TaxID=61149 RepID=A0A2P2NSV5_RHIMU
MFCHQITLILTRCYSVCLQSNTSVMAKKATNEQQNLIKKKKNF